MLTKLQAFSAMQYFLDQYYWLTLADDFGSMLGGLMLLSNDEVADSSNENDWLDSAKVIIPTYHDDMLISQLQAYAIVREFLELYCRIGFSQEVQDLIDRMMQDENGQIIDLEIRQLWIKATGQAVQNGPMYFKLI